MPLPGALCLVCSLYLRHLKEWNTKVVFDSCFVCQLSRLNLSIPFLDAAPSSCLSLPSPNCVVVFQVPPSTPGTKSTPAEREEEEEPEEPVIKPAPRFAKFERNNFKCTRCLKVCYAMPCHAGPCCVMLWHAVAYC